MASRYFGLDLKDFLLSLAQDGTKGINAMIATIVTERSLTGDDVPPNVATFTDFPSKTNALPEYFLDMEGSEVVNDEDSLGGGGDTIGTTQGTRFPDSTPEIFTVNMIIAQKSNLTQFVSHVEIYGEALYRVFHKYCDSNIMDILATASIRDGVQTLENQTFKVIGYSFDVRIDKS